MDIWLKGSVRWIPSTVKAHCPFLNVSCCRKKKKKKKKKTKLLNSAKSTCQRQFPSPTHSDIKMVTFSPTLQSPPSQVCEVFFLFIFFIFRLLRCLTPMPPCFPLKTFLFALYISPLSPFCPLFFNMSIFLSLFISFSPSLSLSHSLPLNFSLTLLKIFSPPLFVINQEFEQRHSVRGISREADEISGAHLSALYGDLLGWDKQQASHHSQPNRLPPACVYSYCTATTTAIRGGVAPGGLLCGRGSLTLLSGSLPSIRSRKQASTSGLREALMAQFLSLSL